VSVIIDLSLLVWYETDNDYCIMKSILTGENHPEYFHKGKTVFSEIFEGINDGNKNKDAFIFNDTVYSYEFFKKRIIQIVDLLDKKGVKKGDRLVIKLKRDPDLICTIFAVSLLGGIYVPVSPLYPKSMVDFILEDSESVFFVTSEEGVPCGDSSVVNISLKELRSVERDIEDILPDISLDEESYVLYTSGTTGVPKGVAIRHKSILNDVYYMVRTQMDESHYDRVLFSTNICFDQSLEEILPGLLLYKTIIVAQDFYDTKCLNQSPTLVVATPTVFRSVISDSFLPRSVTAVVLGGEKVNVKDIEDIFRTTNVSIVFNSYGPTECTDQCCVKKYCRDDKDLNISVGFPIANTMVYVLDENLRPVDYGEVGEIYISGAGVSPGYLNRDDSNSKNFIRDPFSTDEVKMFKTGDFGMINSSLELECIDRIDNQIKLNGQRIESDAVVNAMMSIEGVKSAVLNVHVDSRGFGSLYAYMTPKSVNLTKVKSMLQKKFPASHVPSNFFLLSKFPETSNGKLDVKSLPVKKRRADEVTVSKPTNKIERDISELFKQVLRISGEVGRFENFYELGGHSILASQLVSRINNQYGISLDMLSFVENPTPKKLADLITEHVKDTDIDFKSDLLSIQQDLREFPEGGKNILVIGSGISGLKTALFLKKKGVVFDIIEKNSRVGGVWLKTSKKSKLQVTSDNYEIDGSHKYSKAYPQRDEVIDHIESVYRDSGIFEKIQFNSEVVDVGYNEAKKIIVTTKSNEAVHEKEYDSIVVCTGRLQEQNLPAWASNCHMAGRAFHASELDSFDLKDKDVVVVGAGSYAVESFISAHEQGARNVTLIARKTYWVLPSFAEIVLNSYIDKETLKLKDDYYVGTSKLRLLLIEYYKTRNLEHFIPEDENSSFGVEASTSDFFFDAAQKDNSTLIVGEIDHIIDNDLYLKTGIRIKYDYIICGTGYKTPKFDFLKRISGSKTYIYKGYMSLSDPRIAFVGLIDDIISFVKPLEENIQYAFNAITKKACRPSLAKIKSWISETPSDMILNYKSFISLMRDDE